MSIFLETPYLAFSLTCRTSDLKASIHAHCGSNLGAVKALNVRLNCTGGNDTRAKNSPVSLLRALGVALGMFPSVLLKGKTFQSSAASLDHMVMVRTSLNTRTCYQDLMYTVHFRR